MREDIKEGGGKSSDSTRVRLIFHLRETCEVAASMVCFSPMRMFSLFDQRRLLGGTFILAVTQLGASVAGLLRDRVMYQTFPGLGVTDVYFASFRPSDFLFQACIASALGTVLVPMLAGYRTKGETQEAAALLSATMNLGAIVFGVLGLALAVALPWVAPFLVQFEGEKLATYIQFGRLALLSNFLFVFGSTLGQHLITEQRYWLYGITPILYTIGTIFGTMVLTPHIGAYGPIVGTVIGAFVYAVVRAADVYATGVRFLPVVWHTEFPAMGWLMLPRVISLGALQLQLLFFDAFGSGLEQGAITINAAARNFESVVVGAVGIALAQAVYSPLSQAAARLDRGLYVHYLKRALFYAVILTVPGAVALVFLAPVAAWLVSLSHVLPVFSVALLVYAVAIPFESLNHLLLRAYYALKDTLLPAISTLMAGGTAVAVAWALLPQYGVFAIAGGFVAGQVVQTVGLGIMLKPRLRKMRAA